MAEDKKTTEKTLNELINGRITDNVYVPRDIDAVYHLEDLLDISKPIKVSVQDADSREDAISELRQRIKESSDCIKLRSLKAKEVEEIIKSLPENQDKEDTDDEQAPFKERLAFKRFYAALVCVSLSDGTKIGKYEKDIDYWVEYLQDIMDNLPASFLRIVEKMDRMAMTAKRESKVLDDIDFLS